MLSIVYLLVFFFYWKGQGIFRGINLWGGVLYGTRGERGVCEGDFSFLREGQIYGVFLPERKLIGKGRFINFEVFFFARCNLSGGEEGKFYFPIFP